MKKVFVIISFLTIVFGAKSQNLTVEGTAPNLYINHTVAPKDNFYSVGRLYNQNAKAIASFNNLVMEKGLVIGQRIKIPLNAQNLNATGNAASGEGLIPLTRMVAKGETLSKLGAELNVSAQNIRQWNNLSSDNIAPGTALVVGHLKVSSSAGVAETDSNPPASKLTTPKQEPVADTKQPAEPKKEEAPLAVQTIVPEKKETAPVARQESAQQAVAAATPPATTDAVKQEASAPAPARSEEPKRAETYSYSSTGSLGSIEGVFSNVFSTDAPQKSLNIKSGDAATFKSTSGWQDKKYYVLMNDVTPGTILKITSNENKVVYAKVLGSMPEMKENNGLLLRMSNAAASYLGIIDPKFPVQISYYQ